MTEIERLEHEVRRSVLLNEKYAAETLREEAGEKLTAAQLAGRPHVIYGAAVWHLDGGEGKEWVCELPPIVGTPSSVKRRRPKAFGKTPEEACNNFDALWTGGKEGVDE